MKKRLILMILALSLGIGACGPKVAATVDGKKIYENDVNRRFDIIKLQEATVDPITGEEKKLTPEEEKVQLEKDEKLKDDILASLIDEAVLLAYAEGEKIGASEEEVTTRLGQIKKSFASEEDFLSRLKESGLTLELLGEEVKKALIYEKVFTKFTEGFELTDEVFLEAIVEAHTKHILVADEATANEVYEKLKAGGDFAALAKEYSKDGSAESGGDLGWYSRYGLVKEYADVAFTQEFNVISEPTQSRFGWHIIVTLGKRTPKLTKEEETEVRSGVAEAKKSESFEIWLEGLKEKADIKING